MARQKRELESPEVGDVFIVRGREYEVESSDDTIVNLVRPESEEAPKKPDSAPVHSWLEPYPATIQGRLEDVEFDDADQVYVLKGTKDSKAGRGQPPVAAPKPESDEVDVVETGAPRRRGKKKTAKKSYRR